MSAGWYQDSRAFFLFFSSTTNVSWITLLCAALRAPARRRQLQTDSGSTSYGLPPAAAFKSLTVSQRAQLPRGSGNKSATTDPTVSKNRTQHALAVFSGGATEAVRGARQRVKGRK